LAARIVHENADSPKQRILSQEALIMTEHSKHAEAHIDSIVRQTAFEKGITTVISSEFQRQFQKSVA
jgi:hypothetical protein